MFAEPAAQRSDLFPGLPDQVERAVAGPLRSARPFAGGRQGPVPQQVDPRVIGGIAPRPGLELLTADCEALALESPHHIRKRLARTVCVNGMAIPVDLIWSVAVEATASKHSVG